MAGGTFTAMNKKRPGAYINFESKPVPRGQLGSRGIVAVPMILTWGDAVGMTEIYPADMLNGTSKKLLGIDYGDDAAQMLREIFKNAVKALVYRINNTGGAVATVSITGATATANYPGTFGNKISVAVAAGTAASTFVVTTMIDGAIKDSQTIELFTDFVDNGYIHLTSITAPPTVKAATPLTGGTNGTADLANYDDYFTACETQHFNVMAVPVDDAATATAATAFIKNQREVVGKKVQAVVVDAPDSDYEGIISIDQGYVSSSGERVEPEAFAAWVAGATAGAQMNQSNTYKIVTGAVDVINPKTGSEIETGLGKGMMMLSRRQDGAIVVEKDINTYVSFTPSKSQDFSKNRVVRTLDEMATYFTGTFENSYIGKVDNNDSGRAILKGDFAGYLNNIQLINAIQNFDSTADLQVIQGADIDSVIVNIAIWPVDAMEKLYCTVTLQ